MKKIFTLLLILAAGTTFAQKSAVNTFFSDYNEDDRFTKVEISGKMFQLLTHIEGETKEEQDILEAITDISGLKMLVCNDCENQESMYSDGINRISGKFDELIRVEDKDENMSFYINETDGRVAELFLIAHDNTEFFVMSMTGDIDLKQMAKIGRAVEIEGLDKLEKIDSK